MKKIALIYARTKGAQFQQAPVLTVLRQRWVLSHPIILVLGWMSISNSGCGRIGFEKIESDSELDSAPNDTEYSTDSDPESDTGTGSDTNTGSDTEEDTGTGSDSETDTGSDSDTGTGSDTETDADTDSDTDTDSDPWMYEMTLILNTSPTGADITSAVSNFPVLIRLDSANFDFQQAQSNGEDIRFRNETGIDLAYEIESWDDGGENASIWVKVDSITENNDTQFITMHWGNNTATDQSDGTAVFDVLDSFAAVWHLNENGNNDLNGYRDATLNGYHGTGTNMTGGSHQPGIAGNCQDLDGTNYITMDSLLGEPANVMINGWADMDSGHAELISIGDAVITRIDQDNTNLHCTYYYGSGWNPTEYPQIYMGTGWHHFVYVVDTINDVQSVYVDGNLMIETNHLDDISYTAGYETTSVGIHADGNWFEMDGRVDELRVDTTTRSPSWIKLCFENQRPDGQTLVEFP